MSQGSIKEDQKIGGETKSLEFKKTLFQYLSDLNIEYNTDLMDIAYEKIEYFLNQNIISTGTRDSCSYILEAIDQEFKIQKMENPLFESREVIKGSGSGGEIEKTYCIRKQYILMKLER